MNYFPQKSETLVYFSCIGEDFKGLLHMCIDTLRMNGYDGNVLVLSDEDKIIDNNTRFVDCISIIKKSYSNISSKNMKTFINDFVNIREYTYILYFDCDILFYNNINALLFLLDKNNVVVQKDSHCIQDDSNTCGLEFLDKEERMKHTISVCSGFVGQRGDRITNIFQLWNDQVVAKNCTNSSDQGALYSAIVRNGLDNKVFQTKLGVFPQRYEPGNVVIFIHYASGKRDQMKLDYQTIKG